MALLVHLDGERWLADAGLGEGYLDPLPFREGATTIGPFTYTLEREAGGSWWMGQHEWGSFTGFRMPEEESPSRPSTSTTAGCRPIPESSFVKTLVVQQPRVDRIVTLRARTLSVGRPVGGHAAGRRRSRRVPRGAARRLRDHRRRRAAGAAVGAAARPARGVPGPLMTVVATHPGNFHADDVFAVAVLRARPRPAGDRAHARRGGAGRRGLPRRHRRALRSGDRRLRPPPARRRRRAAERHPLRVLRARLARVRRAARRARARTRSTSGSSRASTPTTRARTSRTALFDGIRPMSVSGVIAAMNPSGTRS